MPDEQFPDFNARETLVDKASRSRGNFVAGFGALVEFNDLVGQCTRVSGRHEAHRFPVSE